MQKARLTDIRHRSGERRIRVITLALPTTSNLSEVFASADQVAIATLLANKAVERSLTHKLEDSRDHIFAKLVEVLTTYKTSMTAAGSGASAQLAISENLKMLPVLVLGLLKNVSIRSVNDSPLMMLMVVFRLVFDKVHKYLQIFVHTLKPSSHLSHLSY